MKNQINKLKKNKRGVFGLTSVQSFFAIILGVALLGYVIVVIMGTLQTTSILTLTESVSVVNESAYINGSGYFLKAISQPGFINPAITEIFNNSNSSLPVPSSNYTLDSNGLIQNTSDSIWNWINISYTYSKFTTNGVNTNGVLSNTSSGITNFFTNISPVYAILAILVIILILVVLVRVVSGTGAGSSSRDSGQVL